MESKALQTTPDKFEKHLHISHDNVTAIDVLAEHTGFSRQKLKLIMQKGAVWLTQGKSTQRIRRASKKLHQDNTLHLYYNAKILAQTDYAAQLIADEGDYSVWYKPSGMLSQGSKYGDHGAIYRWAEMHLTPQRNAFLVHRLDRATSGLILIAHSKNAARILSNMFKERHIDKYYKALVHGVPDTPQTLDAPLEDKKAITKILSSEKQSDGDYSLLDIQILTGRKHQIRQHLANIGHPIIGDRLYGQGYNDKVDLRLTAYKMTFNSPFKPPINTDNSKIAASQAKHYELGSDFYPLYTNINITK
jgi:tRNA pseudouridine32 synthase/23S rRNA pseudouridine746 synthase